jgi:hypothetical protein
MIYSLYIRPIPPSAIFGADEAEKCQDKLRKIDANGKRRH